jgi:hypothetical protein
MVFGTSTLKKSLYSLACIVMHHSKRINNTSKNYNISTLLKNKQTKANDACAAVQAQPNWTTHHHYRRSSRPNSRYLLKTAIGNHATSCVKINHTFLSQRADEFVWGKSSPLRSVSMTL